MMGGHKVEVLYIDYGNKETVDAGWLKMLPGELRLCPGLATAWSLKRKIFFLQNSLPTWQLSVNTVISDNLYPRKISPQN